MERIMVTVKQYDNGIIDVVIERYGYHHTHRKVSTSSVIRLAQVTQACQKETTRNVTHMAIVIKL